MKLLTKLPVFIVILLFAACKKDNVAPVDNAAGVKKHQAVAGTFWPTSGVNFTAVTINGNFGTNPAAIKVKFNGVAAIVNSATTSQVVATVPHEATTGKISVTVNGITKTSSTDFKVLKIVKEGSLSTDFYINKLSFDKSGNGITYLLTTTGVKKITANGSISTLYTAPPISLPKYYGMTGIDNDGLGNVYITRSLFLDSTYRIEPEGWVNTVTLLKSSVVLKINAAGQATTLLGDGVRTNFKVLYDIKVNAKQQNLLLLQSELWNVGGILTKVTSSGNTQNVNWLRPGYCFFPDNDGNYYTISPDTANTGKLFKVDANGTATYISGKGGEGRKDGPANVATFESPNGLVVDNVGNVIILHRLHPFRVVNTAGYAGILSGSIPDVNINRAMYYNYFNNKIYIVSHTSTGSIIRQYALK
ncbi:hypothetical protein DJ568_00310 [Mucilaginibacter hurinus]|uniref:IPT/TIG domain-containing protein n=1 Tax=Mucilaginibacter hurinus TaxID=2201324 RepID=A0A367GSC4_9SPHI|nr:IPT/TIG domain-containing protein [Mucilaginibacter hurinus]RCH56339.1 hypothetical protein DJ568_00310 [Mucilaginibacter hurinus]